MPRLVPPQSPILGNLALEIILQAVSFKVLPRFRWEGPRSLGLPAAWQQNQVDGKDEKRKKENCFLHKGI
jgi:hypothetical protein